MSETTFAGSVEFPIDVNGKPKAVSLWQLITGKFEILPVGPNGVAPKPALKTNSRSRSERKKPYLFGIVVALIGLSVLLVAILLDQFHPTRFGLVMGLYLLGHLGIATLLLG